MAKLRLLCARCDMASIELLAMCHIDAFVAAVALVANKLARTIGACWRAARLGVRRRGKPRTGSHVEPPFRRKAQRPNANGPDRLVKKVARAAFLTPMTPLRGAISIIC